MRQCGHAPGEARECMFTAMSEFAKSIGNSGFVWSCSLSVVKSDIVRWSAPAESGRWVLAEWFQLRGTLRTIQPKICHGVTQILLTVSQLCQVTEIRCEIFFTKYPVNGICSTTYIHCRWQTLMKNFYGEAIMWPLWLINKQSTIN